MTRLDAAALNPAQLRAWRNALMAIFAASGAVLASWISRIPSTRDALGTSTFAMAMLLLAMATASISGTVAASAVSRRWDPGPLIRITQSTAAIGLIVIGLGSAFSSVPLAAVGYALLGFSLGTCDVAMNVDSARNERRLGRPVLPLFHAAYSCGTILGAAGGSLAEYQQVPVMTHFILTGAGIVATTVWAARHVPAGEPVHRGQSAAVRSWPWQNRRIVLIAIFVLSMALSEGAAGDWLSLAMVDGHHASNAFGALVFGLFVVAMTSGRIGSVYALRRFGRVPVLRTSVALTAVGLVLVIVSPVAGLAAAGAALWGLGTAVGFPTGISAAADDPAAASANVSAVAATSYIALLAGPPVIGILGQRIGLLPALWVVLAVVLAGGAAVGAAREQHPSNRLGSRNPAPGNP